MEKFNYDRECPSCGEMSLLEEDGTHWKCHNEECNELFHEEYLDECDE